VASSITPNTSPTQAAVPQAVLQPNSGMVLTVGAGMEFASLKDALAASVDGDTIAVKAGTYTNDFGTVTTNVRIVAVGGMVNEVATVPAPNGKAILTVDNTLSIQGFTFSGGTDNSIWGNIAGLRLENGSLNVSYCYFHDNENGLLAGADPTASVTIDHSEFGHNGSGDGLTHNLYVGEVASLSITNSYFHDAVVGHEIKSRALVTTITNNVIADGPNGTASYDIDLPNGGVAKIANNVLEKGANASNWYVIHYGGETQYSYSANSLDVSGNTILNDMPISLGTVVLNQSNLNGLTTSANLTGNKLYGFDPSRIFYGAGTETADTRLATEPTYSQASPWTAEPILALASGPELLDLTSIGHTVTGGVGRLTVNDTAGSNTIGGGTGGLTLNANVGWDVVTTKAGASDLLNLAARGNLVNAAGNDHIAVTADYQTVNVTGQSTITGSNYDQYGLNGAGEKLTTSCSCVLTAGNAVDASVFDLGGDIQFSLAAGGTVYLNDQATTVHGGTAAGAVISNGAATGLVGNSGTISVTTGNGGARVQAFGGAVSITGGAGADTLVGGTGTDMFTLGGGADQVAFGSGSATVTGGTGADTYTFRSGAHGIETIVGFKQGIDTLHMAGFTGAAIAKGSIVGGSTLLTLTDGTTIKLVGVALPGYAAPSTGPGTGGNTGGSGPGAGTSTGTLTLVTGGQVVTGSAVSVTTVSDLVGGNTIVGGAGGLSVSAGTADFVSTAANSADQVALFRYDTLTGAGADQVTVSANANTISERGAATIVLLGAGNLVGGGAGLIHVTDTVGCDTVDGGAGGVVATLAGAYDVVNTAAGAADTISVGGRDIINSAGADHISVNGSNNQLMATGAAVITSGAGWGSYDLEGSESLAAAGAASVTVGRGATVTVSSAGNDGVGIVKLAGGTLAASETLAGIQSTLDVSGGASTISATVGSNAGLYAYSSGGVQFTAGTGAATVTSAAQSGSAGDTVDGGAGNLVVNGTIGLGIDVVAGSGNVTLNGGSGNDVFVGGAGTAQLNLGCGADTVTLGHGSMTVQGGVADIFVVPGSADGSLVIQNWTAQDSLVTPGHQPLAITAETVVGGSTFLTLAGGAQIELVGFNHFT
jgi:hypothetical protein